MTGRKSKWKRSHRPLAERTGNESIVYFTRDLSPTARRITAADAVEGVVPFQA